MRRFAGERGLSLEEDQPPCSVLGLWGSTCPTGLSLQSLSVQHMPDKNAKSHYLEYLGISFFVF